MPSWTCFELGTQEDKELSGAKDHKIEPPLELAQNAREKSLWRSRKVSPTRSPRDPGHKW